MPSRVSFPFAKYLGGHPIHPAAVEGPLEIDEAGLHQRRFREVFVVPWADITAVEVEGPEQVEKRVTVTRLLTVGLFAFAAKKKQKVAYVVAATADGELVFEVGKRTPLEVRAEVSPWVAARLAAGPAGGGSGVADELAKLAQLRDAGVLSEAEFQTQKAKILG